MSFHVRVCRECGEEYRPDIVRCADCGGELEDVYEDAARPARAPAAAPAEPDDLADHRTVFETTRAADLLPLAERLRESEIPFRLAEKAPAGDQAPVQFVLLVPDGQSKAALLALAPLLAPHGEDEGFHAVETSYEDGRGYVTCPACGTEPPAGASECPECGLVLGGEASTCARCGSPLPAPDAECPSCGGLPSLD
jgi:Double zinc ribbon